MCPAFKKEVAQSVCSFLINYRTETTSTSGHDWVTRCGVVIRVKIKLSYAPFGTNRQILKSARLLPNLFSRFIFFSLPSTKEKYVQLYVFTINNDQFLFYEMGLQGIMVVVSIILSCMFRALFSSRHAHPFIHGAFNTVITHGRANTTSWITTSLQHKECFFKQSLIKTRQHFTSNSLSLAGFPVSRRNAWLVICYSFFLIWTRDKLKTSEPHLVDINITWHQSMTARCAYY